MKKRLLLIGALFISLISGCGNINSEISSSNLISSNQSTTSFSSSTSSSSTSSSKVSLSEVEAYYKDIDFSTTGSTLKSSLHGLIKVHDTLSYSNLWDAFGDTDLYSDGTVWDMYSATKWKYRTDQNTGGTSGYNREHSVPKSWFNDESPMYTDLFHLYPTDTTANSKRSNYPFGEVGGTASYTSSNGCKLGSNSFSGYSGTVFEPADEYKGDFARTYFYFATCYQNKTLNSGYGSAHFTSNSYPKLTTYSINLFFKWSSNDPVSQKEIDRNNAVFDWQGNRNPFIDYPGLESSIWEK